MTFKEYLEKVKEEATALGYDISAIESLLCNILVCYNLGANVQECVDEIF